MRASLPDSPFRKRFRAAFFSAVPDAPGVYFMRGSRDEILYVGKAKSLRARLLSYRSAKNARERANILELLESVRRIDWEEHATEQKASLRESELIHALTPPYNVAECWEESYLFVRIFHEAAGRIRFQLTSEDPGKAASRGNVEIFGCYRHRTRVKRGYSALLRLLYAALFARQRFSFPAKISRTVPAYDYAFPFPIPSSLSQELRLFLSGESSAFLGDLFLLILDNPSLPGFVRPGILEDLQVAREFFENCAHPNRKSRRSRPISHAQMRAIIRASIRSSLRLPRDRPL